jgi:hypothetical protein
LPSLLACPAARLPGCCPQVIRGHEQQWSRLEDKLSEILAELPCLPHLDVRPLLPPLPLPLLCVACCR